MTVLARIWSRRPAEPDELARQRRRFWINAVAAVGGVALLWILPDLAADLPRSVFRLLGVTVLYVVAVMGLNLVFGLAGQVTLGPAAVFAVGAYVSGVLSTRAGLSPWLAIAVGVIGAGIVGVAIGAPALRVGGFYLAMVTAFAAQAIPATVVLLKSWTGGPDGLLGIRPLTLLDGAPLTIVGRYRVALVLMLVSALLVANVARSAWGRWFRCLTASEIGTSALGVSVYQAKVVAFLFSALFGGLAGGFYAHFQQVVSPFEYGFDLSITLFAAAVIGGLGTLWGPVLGTALFYLGPHYLLPDLWGPGWAQVAYGLLLILVMVVIPDGVAPAFGALGGALRRAGVPFPRVAGSASSATAPGRADETALRGLLTVATGARRAGPALRAEGVSKRFGGVRALSGAYVEVAPGAITALIGPNGSGKTTLLNVCCGYTAPDAGRVLLGDRDVTAVSAHHRALGGLARTLQHAVVFPQLTGAQSVMAGHARLRPSPWAALLGLPSSRRHERAAAARAEAVLAALGVHYLDLKLGRDCSLAEARILDLARSLALDPSVLVLDEPAAGLDLHEVELVAELVRAARGAGIGVLLVDHDVAFVTKLADRVIVLDQGSVIYDGGPAGVRADPRVAAAYFGDVEPTV